MTTFRDASQIGPRWRENLFLRLAVLTPKVFPRGLLVRAWSFADALRNLDFQRRNFGRSARIVRRREQIWEVLSDEINSVATDSGVDRPLSTTTFEFGVAYGYATDFFLGRVSDSKYRHIGFDTFCGLERGFREFGVGAFSTDGTPPDISDSRVTWRVGNVLETVSADNLRGLAGDADRRIFFFDLDLFEPTQHVLKVAVQVMRKGDVLYFDEPLDAEESVILTQLLDGQYGPFKFSHIAGSPISMALRVE